MKKPMLFALLICFISNVRAANYYFSSSIGSDSYSTLQAQNPATPWKSLGKLNLFFQSLYPGDSVLFKRGDTFYGSLTISKSGSSTLPITIGAYGIGAKPVFTGFTNINNWTAAGNGIWESTDPAFGNILKIVCLNGILKGIGRYPNTDAPNEGYLTINSHTNNTTISSSELSSAPDFSGGDVVIRKNFWVLDRCTITNYSKSSISYSGGTSYYNPQDGFGFFIQNHVNTLDQLGEWCYNVSNGKLSMYFGSTEPKNYSVSVATIENIISASSKNYVNLDNITFNGANGDAIYLTAGSNFKISNCEFFNLTNGVNTYPNVTNNVTVLNSSFKWINDHGILLSSSNSIIRDNKLSNIGTFAGMGSNGDGGLKAIWIIGANNLIEYNNIDTIGYSGIRFDGGNNNVIKNNFINHFCFIKDDGGGIYTFNSNGSTNIYTGQKIVGNIITNAIGAPKGVAHPEWYKAAHGIYLDENAGNIEISGNTIANSYGAGLFSHNANNLEIRNNTLYNNGTNVSIVSDNPNAPAPVRNINLNNNILFSESYADKLTTKLSYTNDITSFGNSDSNYYVKPFDENSVVYETWTDAGKKMFQDYNIIRLRASRNDKNSKESPVKLKPYVLENIIGPNKFNNGSFTSDISGTSSWSQSGNINASWSSGKLDGGAFQAAYNYAAKTTNPVSVTLHIGSLAANKYYVARFSLLGTKNNATVGVFLRKSGLPYNSLSYTKYIYPGTTRREHELLFTSSTTVTDGALVFELRDQDSTIYIDNVQVYEANVRLINPSNYFYFDYNKSKTTKTTVLNAAYIGMDSSIYKQSFTLQPYSSIVLIKSDSANNQLPAKTFFKDADGDKFGNSKDSIVSTIQPSGYVSTNNDCDDVNALIYPGAVEVCNNGIDDNCNGQIDENCGTSLDSGVVSTPSLSIKEVTVYESQKIAKLMVTLSNPCKQPVSVNYVTIKGTATTKNYTPTSGTLTFPEGTTTSWVSVDISYNKKIEPAKYFDVQLNNPRNASIATGTGRVTILDGTPPYLEKIVITNDSIQENSSIQVLRISATPNPSTNCFHIRIQSSNSQPVMLKVFDTNGLIAESKGGIAINTSFELGHNLKSGVYIIEVIQGNERVTTKLIKI